MPRKIGINQICKMVAPSLYHTRYTGKDQIISALKNAIETLKDDGFVLDGKPRVGYSITRVHYEMQRYKKTNGNKDTGIPVHD